MVQVVMKMRVSLIFLLPLLSVCSANFSVCRCDERKRVVTCSHVRLKDFDKSFVTCSQPAWHIDLSQNSLSVYPDDLHDYKIVNLTRNGLSHLKAKKSQNVERLDVSGNAIIEIDLQGSFLFLKHLYASYNNLGLQNAYFFRGSCNLVHLDVSVNKITLLQPITHCARLEILSAARNGITSLPESLSQLAKLETLDLSFNRLTQISELPTALKKLDLSFNAIVRISSASFKGLTALTELDLSSNAISDVDGGAFTDLAALEQLRMENNRLAALSSRFFVGLRALRVFGASYNDVARVAEDAFAALPALDVVNLNGNLLTRLPALRFAANLTAATFVFNAMRAVDTGALLGMMQGAAGRRSLNFPLNPLRGDDPAWARLLRSGFSAECLLKWPPMLAKMLEEPRAVERLGQQQPREQRLAPGACPCARFTKGEWAVGACVADVAFVGGLPWLRAARHAAEHDAQDNVKDKDEL